MAEQISCVKPGRVNEAERMPPPMVDSASISNIFNPACCRTMAADNPLGPDPTTSPSYLLTGRFMFRDSIVYFPELNISLNRPRQAGWAATAFYTNFFAFVNGHAAAGFPQCRFCFRIAIHHQTFARRQCQHIATHGFKFFVGYFYQPETPVQQLIAE